MKVLFSIFIIYLIPSNALPLDQSENITSFATDDSKNFESFLQNLLNITEDSAEFIDNNRRHKRDLPEWANVLLKCSVHYVFPQVELVTMVADVEGLFDKGFNAEAIINEMSTKYENIEMQNEVQRQKRSVEEIRNFFQNSCVKDAINYGLKNRERIKDSLKSSLEWAKDKIKKIRESKEWDKIRKLF